MTFSYVRGGAALLLAYLLGAIPFSYIFTRWVSGEDIRTLGNRNAGAANVFRAVSRTAGAAASVLDIAKGAAGVALVQAAGLTGLWSVAGGVAAVLGHNYPVYLKFRGGRGLGASIGALLMLMPLETAMVLPLLGVIFLVVTGSAITGAIISFLCLISLAWWREQPLSHILAPLVFLLTMGARWIPQEIHTLCQVQDKKGLLKSALLHTRYTSDGQPKK